MQKTFKKILCTLLVVVICLTSAPLEGFVGMEWPELPKLNISEWFSSEASALSSSGSCGENVTYTYNSSTGELVISGTGDMYSFSHSGSPFNKSDIISVVIENGVTGIFNYTFSGCTSLTSITIPASVTSIGNFVFKGCTSLTSIIVDENNECYSSYKDAVLFNKDKTTLFRYFEGNERITYTIPDSVTSIGGSAFSDCTGLKSVTIPDSVTSIGYDTFSGCTSLTSVTIPDGVTSIGNSVFDNCTSLTSVTIPDSVTTIGTWVFNNCTSLTSITIPDSVTSIGSYAFKGCTSLEAVYISDMASWCNIEFSNYDAYRNPLCYAGNLYLNSELVTDLIIPDSVTSIGQNAFRGCTSITSVTIPDSVTSIGYEAFRGCTSLTSVTIPDSVTSIGQNAFYDTSYYNNESNWENGVLYLGNHLVRAKYDIENCEIKSNIKTIGPAAFISCTSLTSVTIPDSVTSIGYEAFRGCTSLTSVTIPDSVTSIVQETFFFCTSLTSVTIPDSVTTIGNYAFSDCTSLTSVTIPDSVTSIGYEAFRGCTSLTSVTIPDSVTSIAQEMFSGCTSLTSVTIPDSVTSIGGNAFSGCTSLASVSIGDNVRNIGYNAFGNCIALTSITIPNNVTNIGDEAFSSCDNLTSVTIGDGANISSDTIMLGKYAFSFCENLKNVKIGNTPIRIGEWAFSYCDSLTSITIPDSVTAIGDYAFWYCTNLTSITIGSVGIGSYVFVGTNLQSLTISEQASNNNSEIYIDSYTFDDCTGLTQIYISDIETWCNINFESAGANPLYDGAKLYLNNILVKDLFISDGIDSIRPYAFYNYTSLTSVTIPDSVTSIGSDAFYNCKNLKNVYYTSNIDSWFGISFSNSASNPTCNGANLYCDNVLVEKIIIPDSIENITPYAFCGCISLKEVVISDNVIDIGCTAFNGCTNLASVTIGNSVTNIGNSAFSGCTNLTSVTIPDSVTSIGGGAFEGCTNLTSVTIGNGVTSIGNSAFYKCDGLTSVTIGNGVTSIGDYAFYNCKNLENVYYTSNIDSWFGISFSDSTSNPTCYGANLYCDNVLVERIIVPDDMENITPYAFYGCISLKEVVISDNVIDIGNAFNGCTNLTIICSKGSAAETYAKNKYIDYVYGGYLSNGLYWELNGLQLIISGDATAIPGFAPGQAPWSNLAEEIRSVQINAPNLKKIGQYAFFGLSDTLQVDICSENLVSIGKYAFFGLRSEIQMYFDGTSGQWDNVTLDYGNDAVKQAYIYCRGDDYTFNPVHIPEKSDGLTFENFVEEHVVLAEESLTPDLLKTVSFYNNAVIDGTVLNALGAWDVIGDIGKAISFKFDGYSFQANYFDVYLSELILALNNQQKTSNLEWKVGETYNKHYKAVMDLLKTSEEWDKKATPKTEEELADAFKGKTFELTDGTKNFLETVFNDLYKNHKSVFSSIFEGLDTASEILDSIKDAADIANMFIKAYNSYVVSKAFYEVNDEFFEVCTEAASLRNASWYIYRKEFLESVKKAKASQLGSLETIYNTMYSFTESAVAFAYEKVLQNTIQTTLYPAVASILGCAAGEVSATTFAYNVGYKIANVLFNLDKKSEAYKTMNAIAPIEGILQSIVSTYRSRFLNNQTEENAKKYDMAYNILRQTNIYLYDTAYKYGSYVKNKDEMNLATKYKNKWTNWKCHYGNYGSAYNLFSAHCPVDVYIYDANGLLVTSVINEEICEYSSEITVSVSDGQKSFAYSTDKDYTVKIVAREEGTMDYSAGVVTDTESQFEVKSYNIPLAENQEFTVNMPTSDEETTEEDYKLQTNETPVDFDYSSAGVCEEHSFGEWTDEAETKERKCVTCGYIEYMTVCNHDQYETIMAYSVVPTCQNGGHTIYVCSGCGEQISDGEDVEAVACDYLSEEFEAICTEKSYIKYTCCYCDNTYYEGITEEELNASAHNYTETVVDATCISGGYTEYTCEVCEHTYIDNKTAINKDAHKEEFTSVTEPTCTENGYTTYTCTLCENTSNRDETGATGHSYKSVVTKPTCTTGGYTTYTCSNCADTYVADETGATGHSYKSVVTKPTCTTGGYTTYTCSKCADTYVADETGATGHSYKSVVTKPTCTTDGYTTYTCSNCADIYVADITGATGHSYKSVVTKPTCTTDGYTTYTCHNCGQTYTDNKTSATGHKYTTEKIDNGCLEDSIIIYTCSCGASYSEIVSAPGHDFEGSNCKNCDYDKADSCSCNCHKSGFIGIIWKILKFFYKIFKTNPVCDCGTAHY